MIHALKTPLLLLAVLTGPWLASRVLSQVRRRDFDGRQAGALGAALLFLFTSIGHFVQTTAMAGMLPGWVPMRTGIVHASGVFEIILAVGILNGATRRRAGLTAIAMLIAFFPANVYASLTGSPMGGGAMGPWYLLIRTPLQLIFMMWIYVFCVTPGRQAHPDRF